MIRTTLMNRVEILPTVIKVCRMGMETKMPTLGNRGFSIVELMVALAVSGILVTLLASAYIAQKRSFESESELREMNLKGQLAMNLIKQYIRNAGLGAEHNLETSSSVLQGANRNFSDVFNVASTEARSDGPDTMHIVTGFPSRSRVVCGTGACTSNMVEVEDSSHFDTGRGQYVFFAPSLKNRYQTINLITGNVLTLSESVTVHNNDPVYRVNAHTITLDLDGGGSQKDVDNDGVTDDGDDTTRTCGENNEHFRPDLYLYDNRFDLSDETESLLVEGIEDLQFQYLMDSDDSGVIETDEDVWQDDPTGNLEDILAVRIWLLVRSNCADPNYIDEHTLDGLDTPGYTVADHDITLDTNDGNGFYSLYDQHFHRLLMVETMMVRNKAL